MSTCKGPHAVALLGYHPGEPRTQMVCLDTEEDMRNLMYLRLIQTYEPSYMNMAKTFIPLRFPPITIQIKMTTKLEMVVSTPVEGP